MLRRTATTAGLAAAVVVTLASSLTTAVVRAGAAEPVPPPLVAAPPPRLEQPVVTKPFVPPVPAKPKAAATACPAPPPVPADIARAGHANGSGVDVYAAPGGRFVRRLPSPTRDYQRLVVGVRESRGEWLLVQYNERPNGVTGWIRSSQVIQTLTPYRIVVERCAKRLTLYRGGVPVMREPVAVGTPRTPTPLGSFYVDFIEKKANPRGSYGPYMLSVSGFSEVYMRFGKGGVGQIAIHGTNKRSSVGKAASNGCVRMHNEAVSRLAYLVPSGTPVTIVA